ncbi:MAG: ABC transporter substrate-binding protein [Chloroflexi bacterium OHK40]
MLQPRWTGVLLLMLLFALTACSSAAPAAAPTAPAAAPTAPAAQRDELLLAIGGESEDGYDPTLGWGRYGSPLFQSTLLRRDENLQLVNDLATGYTVSDDRLTWTVTIRDDVVFSDGVPLTAEDVAYTFTKAAESGGLTDVTVLESARATGPTTVELRLKEPQSTFVNRLVTLGIVPRHAHGPDYAQQPIGSGPFVLVSWDKGKQLVVEANPRYYGQQPAFKRLVFLFVDNEADGAFVAARAGQVQVASVPQSYAVEQIPGMRMLAVKSVDNRGIMLPYVPDEGKATPEGNPIGNDVTADLAIRQAVNYAIDRPALVAGVLESYGSPAYGPVSGLAWEEPGAVIPDANVARAQEILAAGGWADSDGDGIVEKDGLKAEFTLIYPASDTIRQALALSAADMVRPAGIQMNVEGKSWDDIQKLMHSNAILFGWGSHDQTEMYNLYHSSTAGQGWYNTGFYANQAIDTTLDLAMGAPSEQEAIAFWKAAQWDGTKGFTAQGDAAWAWMVNLYHTYFVDECLDVGQPQVEPHGHGWPITAGILNWRWTCGS